VYFNEGDSISLIYMFVAVFNISCILLILHHIMLGLPAQHSLSLWHTHTHTSVAVTKVHKKQQLYLLLCSCMYTCTTQTVFQQG